MKTAHQRHYGARAKRAYKVCKPLLAYQDLKRPVPKHVKRYLGTASYKDCYNNEFRSGVLKGKGFIFSDRPRYRRKKR